MPESSQLASRCGNADLEVGYRRALDPLLVEKLNAWMTARRRIVLAFLAGAIGIF